MAVNTTVEVVMPPMGDSVSEGSILEWHKQEGDEISEDETLVEISTDKVDAEVPAPVSGTVVKIHAAEGDTVGVGSVLAEIAPSNGTGPAITGDDDDADAPAAAASEAPATVIEIEMPAMGSNGRSSPGIRSPKTRRSSRSRRTKWTRRSPRRLPAR
jgi:2-oxoglutarate dehydrogenase E1 component